jgi:hypothetical protein
VAALTDEEIRRALADAPRISFARHRPGHVLIDRERLLDSFESQGHDREQAGEQVEAWVSAAGGRTRWLDPPVSHGLRPGRRVAPLPGSPTVALEVGSDRL